MADRGLVEPAKLKYVNTLRFMAMLAVNRSAGQLEAFFGRQFVTAELLNYIGDRAPSLKTLRLISCNEIGNRGFVEAMKKFPLLEELELAHCAYLGNGEAYEIVGKSCPHLKSFKLINGYTRKFIFEGDPYIEYLQGGNHEDQNSNRGNDEALGIASMIGLHTLHLFCCDLSNWGLTAILDACTNLESLDIRQCFYLKIDAAMKARLASLKTVRLPFDPTDDYEELNETPDGSDDCFHGYDPILGHISYCGDYEDYCDFDEYF
ncbi:unnamed protein product [Urochloa humidicola]